MFDDLEREIREIGGTFHICDGPADSQLAEAINNASVSFPRSYVEFVLKFGNAKLYRKLSYHKVGVLGAPREEIRIATNETVYHIGHYDSSKAYFKQILLKPDSESPVFEGRSGTLQKVADGFEQWLKKRCNAARRTYRKAEWQQIVAGPLPFTPQEQDIINARRLFTCRVVGVASDGKLWFEIHNGSDTVLPYLSVRLWRADGKLEGGVWLPVSHIGPGKTAVVEHESYRGLVDPHQLEYSIKPDPQPDERDRYWEFK